MSAPGEIFSVGHSVHDGADFIALLEGAGVRLLADVRRHPGSRRVPWTNPEPFRELLSERSIGYLHMPELGGRRRPAQASANAGWRVAQFQGYADHMGSAEFATGLIRLEQEARERPTAMMCAEAQWWRCHRRMISDALVVRGWRVLHIDSRGAQSEHALTDFAIVEEGRLRYPDTAGEADRKGST